MAPLGAWHSHRSDVPLEARQPHDRDASPPLRRLPKRGSRHRCRGSSMERGRRYTLGRPLNGRLRGSAQLDAHVRLGNPVTRVAASFTSDAEAVADDGDIRLAVQADRLTAERLDKERAHREMNDSRSFVMSSVELHAASIQYEPDDTGPGRLAERPVRDSHDWHPAHAEPCHADRRPTRWPNPTCPERSAALRALARAPMLSVAPGPSALGGSELSVEPVSVDIF